MRHIEGINSARLEWSCEDRGMSLEELASKTGIATSRFEKVLAGHEGLTFGQLQKVANVLNRGVLFFLEPGGVAEERVHTLQFRTIANQKPALSSKVKALLERVEKQRDVYLSLLEDLGELEERRFRAPRVPRDHARRAGEMAREWLGLAETNTFDDYRQAVERNGILVFRTSGYRGAWQIPEEDSVWGFTLYDPVCPAIVIRKASSSRQTFTLMHELGHVLLHRSSFIDEEDDFYSYQGKEEVANAFAGHLLIPNEFLKRINDRERPREVRAYDGWLAAYRKAWTVSGEVILRRLKDSGRLSQDEYDGYRDWTKQLKFPQQEGGSRKYRYREPKHLFGEPFVRAVLDSLHTKQITLPKASTYLDNLKVADLHKLEGFYHAGL